MVRRCATLPGAAAHPRRSQASERYETLGDCPEIRVLDCPRKCDRAYLTDCRTGRKRRSGRPSWVWSLRDSSGLGRRRRVVASGGGIPLRNVDQPVEQCRAGREPRAVLPSPCMQLLDDVANTNPARVGPGSWASGWPPEAEDGATIGVVG